jgi:hypothetical protein
LAGFFTKANGRKMRVLGCTPGDRVAADRAAMLPLPPVPPEVGWRKSLRLPRDHYVRLDSNDYSVHPAVVGRRIEVHADLDRVWVRCEGAIVADHARVWAQHQTITDFEHTVAASTCVTAAATCSGRSPTRSPARRSRSDRSASMTRRSGSSMNWSRRRCPDGRPHHREHDPEDGLGRH